jgi:hypothetical protein
MEYVALGLILLGAAYVLVRSTRTKKDCPDGLSSCDRCSRVAQPPSDRRYQIELPDNGEKNSP